MIVQDWMHIVAGAELVAAIENEIRSRVPQTSNGRYESEMLCKVQGEQDRRGICGINLTKSIYGWTVRYDSGLQNFGLLAGSRMGNIDGSFKSAVDFAMDWVSQDVARRYAWMRKSEIEPI